MKRTLAINSRLSITALIALLCFSTSENVFSGGYYGFQDQNLALIKDIKGILVNGGMCQDIAHCSNEQVIFSDSTSWGVDVEIYGITNPEIIKKIDLAAAEYFYHGTPGFSIRIRFFSVTKEEDVKSFIFFKAKPFITIHREHIDVKR